MKKLAAIGIGVGAVTIGLYAGISIYTTKVAEAKINEFIAEVDDEVVIEYDKVSVNPFGADVTVKDITVAPIDTPADTVNIDQIIVRQFDRKSDFPTFVDASVQGIKVSASRSSASFVSPVLQKAGYVEPLSFDLDTKYKYNESSHEVTLEKFRIGAEEFGYVDITFKVGNYYPDNPSSEALTLHAAEINYQDNSFVEKLLESMAAESNQDVEQFKAQLTAGLAENAQFFISPDNPTAMAALEEAMAFINNPKGFTISANPQKPLLVSELTSASDPQTWMTMLNLEIESY
jgi:hypothetical protein